MALTAFIFARGGSKGVKDKNIRMAGDKPLIAHAIATALGSAYINRVIVSTDSEKITAAAKQHGADVLARPAELAADDTPELLAWQHALESHSDIFSRQREYIVLSATTPLKISADVDAAFTRFARGDCDVVMGITPARANPYFTMATLDAGNHLKICIDGVTATRRQDIPAVYDIIGGVYVTTPAYLEACRKTGRRLIDGRVGGFEIPAARALDIDTEFDLHLADLLLTHPFKAR